jgi:hypothetical protein
MTNALTQRAYQTPLTRDRITARYCAFLVWINVTTTPTAEWIARQITEAFLWDGAPRYMIGDRDRIYGAVVTRRLRAMGIRDKPIAPASPWQNGFAERLIGSIRRECLDHSPRRPRAATRLDGPRRLQGWSPSWVFRQEAGT